MKIKNAILMSLVIGAGLCAMKRGKPGALEKGKGKLKRAEVALKANDPVVSFLMEQASLLGEQVYQGALVGIALSPNSSRYALSTFYREPKPATILPFLPSESESQEGDGKISMWRSGDLARLWQKSFDDNPIDHIMFSPAGKILLALSGMGEIRYYNTRTGKIMFSYDETPVTAAAFRRDGLLVAADNAGIHVIDPKAQTMKLLYPIQKNEIISQLLVSSDGLRVVAIFKNKILILTKTIEPTAETRTPRIAVIPGFNDITWAQLSVDGKRLLITDQKNVVIYDIDEQKSFGYKSSSSLSNATFVPQYNNLVLIVEGNGVALWNIASREMQSFIPHDKVSMVVMNGPYIITAGNGIIKQWSARVFSLITNQLHHLTAEQKKLLVILNTSIKRKRLLRANDEEWRVFKSLPPLMQSALEDRVIFRGEYVPAKRRRPAPPKSPQAGPAIEAPPLPSVEPKRELLPFGELSESEAEMAELAPERKLREEQLQRDIKKFRESRVEFPKGKPYLFGRVEAVIKGLPQADQLIERLTHQQIEVLNKINKVIFTPKHIILFPEEEIIFESLPPAIKGLLKDYLMEEPEATIVEPGSEGGSFQ